jgi:16S rRNA (cytidine1402-2'-O)-methyltransferase
MSGTLFVVATPIGNLEDIGARALRALRDATLIAAEDTRRTHHLLVRYGITTPTTSLHQHNEAKKLPSLIERLRRGERIAVVSDAGTPTISDPGQHLVRAAIEAGVRVEPIPGPSAALAALVASGFSGDAFLFLGFPPTRSKDRGLWLQRLQQSKDIVVFFEAPHRIRRTLEEVRGIVGDKDISVARELTKIHEQFIRGPISAVLDQLSEPIGEFTVVLNIGQLTDNVPVEAPPDQEMAREFGLMTDTERLSRRKAVSALARRHGLPTNAVYEALERAKTAKS